ncbi:MAG: hypothetical protein FWC01_07770 [Treponema sp.]|nr:hypothetical protein [Treponema sp.]MCL2237794.1 hypothetical protein [Treponema sp.]
MEKKSMFGILVIAFLFGFLITGCFSLGTSREIDPSLNGTWTSTSSENWEFINIYNNGRWEEKINNISTRRGFYTTNNGNIKLTITEFHGNYFELERQGLAPRWYSRRELSEVYGAEFTDAILTYSIDGNQLFMSSSIGSGTQRIWIKL